jgi:hypothetical protein
MQALLQDKMTEEHKQRKPRAKRDTVPVTYRVMPAVKEAVTYSASKYGRSDNQQAEFLLKIGYLYTLGIKIDGVSDIEILDKFNDCIKELANEND